MGSEMCIRDRCKVFGADRGYKLVNGVLDKVAGELRPNEHQA